MEEINHGAATPDLVRRLFDLADRQFVITIDEFDRIQDDDARILTADTIKTIGDRGLPTTLVIVGVADTVQDLIEDHASIGRNLTQVLMPRMSRNELKDIVTGGTHRLGMSVDGKTLEIIATLSQGLPHYTHALALNAAIHAIDSERKLIEGHDLASALNASIQNAHHSVTAAYHAATVSNKPRALLKEVLLACALAPSDDLGYFAPKDVISPLCQITGRDYGIPAFIRHLHAFCDEDRAWVLQSAGPKKRQRYRFTDPVLKPYVVLRGMKESMVDAKYVLKEEES